MATANPGRIVRLGPGLQSPATYTSAVRDTKSASRWGVIRWTSSGNVHLSTRSGNTDTPDDSWSDWSGPYAKSDGELMTSPAARFLQWKATLTSPPGAPAARVTSVTAAYLPRNARPVVNAITVQPPGVVFQRAFTDDNGAVAGLDDLTAEARQPPSPDASQPRTAALGHRMFEKGLQTITWKASDADGDRLLYSLFYRTEGGSAWHPLASNLDDAIFVWDTTSVADGRYIVRVAASDGLSNPPDRALSGDRESDLVVVDNTPPVITLEVARPAGAPELVVHAHDALSVLEKAEYSQSGGPWHLIYPVDGLADSPDEQYAIPLSNEADAAHIAVRVTDALQNIGTHTLTK